MRSVGAREEARDAARFREAAEIQERERRQTLVKRQLAERTRDLQHTVSELERQVRLVGCPSCVVGPCCGVLCCWCCGWVHPISCVARVWDG